MNNLRQMLLSAPPEHLDGSVKPLIEKWGEAPTSLQLLEVLDVCIYGAMASTFTVALLQNLYDFAVVDEGTTHELNIPLASWRKDGN